jgi:hypothetical protein
MAVDPRRLAAIQIQLDALAHEVREHDDSEADAALEHAQRALRDAHAKLEGRGLYLQLPPDYKPPKGTGHCGG